MKKILLLLFTAFVGYSANATTCAGAQVGALGVNTLVCNGTNDISGVAGCGSTNYMGGEEALMTYTPSTAGSLSIAYSGRNWSGIFMWDGCPTTGTCMGNITSSSSTKTLTVNVVAGTTYYIMFDTYPNPASPCAGTATLTLCGGTEVPDYTEDFSTFLDPCWEEAGAGDVASGPSSIGAGDWRNGASTLATNSARINLYSDVDQEWLLSPNFDLTAGGYEVLLDVAVTNWNSAATDAMGSDDFVTLAYTEDGTTWTAINTWSVADALANTLTTFTFPLVSSGSNVRFGILASDGTVDDGEDYDFHVDNFIVRTPPSCVAPTLLNSSSITATSADIGFTCAGCTGDYLVEYSTTSGFTAGTGATAGAGNTLVNAGTSNPVALTGLTPTTTYYYTVRQDCGAGSFSANASEESFTTLCTPITTFPACQAFAGLGALPACWTTYGSENWIIAGAWPDYGAIGATGIGLDGSNTNGNNSTLQSGQYDMTAYAGTNPPQLSFDIFSDNTDNPGDNALVTVEITTDGGTTWSTLTTYQSDGGLVEVIADLSAYTTNTISFRFVADYTVMTGFDFYNDIIIENVCVEEAPSCIVPTALASSAVMQTTATVSWTASVSTPADGYEYEIRTSGAGGSGAAGLVTASTTAAGVVTDNVTGLAAQTAYSLYVRANCGAGDFSTWASTTFTTIGYLVTLNGTHSTCSPYFNGTGGIGVQNQYDMAEFTVPVTGNYRIRAAWTQILSSPDGYLYLYGTSFDPLNPATNQLASNDDFGGAFFSQITSVGLTAGTTYYIVGAAYHSNSLQSAAYEIEGPGLAVVATGAVTAINGSAQFELEPATGFLNRNCDDGTWTYYGNSSEFGFAIEWKPVGSPAGFNDAAKAAAASASVQVGNETGPYGNVNTSAREDGAFGMERWWNVDLGGVALDGPVNIRFYYDAADITALEAHRDAERLAAGYTAATHPNVPNKWFKSVGSEFAPAVINNGNDFTAFSPIELTPIAGSSNGVTYAQFDGVASFSGGTLGTGFDKDAGAALPVDLISFEATAIEEAISLDWITATEINNAGFEVERSLDGETFTKIAFVEGNGNSNQNEVYTLLDKEVSKNISYYYRLKQVDFDGQFEYSNIVSARLVGEISNTEVNVFPNPSNGTVYTQISFNGESTIAQIEVYNVLGAKVISKEVMISAGNNKLAINDELLDVGTYFVKIYINEKVTNHKFTIIK